MGGFVLDIFLMFLVKSLIPVFWFIRSSSWERRSASVDHSAELYPGWGCPSVKVYYQTPSNGSSLQESNEIPFCFYFSAKAYARAFSVGQQITVRVDPNQLLRTLFFQTDQK
jgi:hypothetical protein